MEWISPEDVPVEAYWHSRVSEVVA